MCSGRRHGPPPNPPRNSFGPRTTVGKTTLIGILSLVSVSYELREVIIFPVQWQVVQDALLVTFTASVHWYCFLPYLGVISVLIQSYIKLFIHSLLRKQVRLNSVTL